MKTIAWLGVGFVCFGCGGSGISREDKARACVYMASCGVGVTASMCATDDSVWPDSQLRCVLGAGTDCTAVLACLGIRRVEDPDCRSGCEGNSRITCRGGGDRWDYDCSDYAWGGGDTCIEAYGEGVCASGPCETPSETCDGTVAELCNGVALSRYDCSPSSCFSGRCSDVPLRPCTGFDIHCEGDVLVDCWNELETRIDCSAQGRVCRQIDLGGGLVATGCDQPGECSSFSFEDSCAGTSVVFCDHGEWANVDCVALGYASCESGTCAP